MKVRCQIGSLKLPRKEFLAVFLVAAIGGLILFGIALLTNLILLAFVASMGTGNSQGWLSVLAQIQTIPFGIFSHFTGLEYFLNYEPSPTKTWFFISISDGFWFSLALLVFGFIFRFASAVADKTGKNIPE